MSIFCQLKRGNFDAFMGPSGPGPHLSAALLFRRRFSQAVTLTLSGLQQGLFKWPVDDAPQVVNVTAQGVTVWWLIAPKLPFQRGAGNYLG